MVYQHSHFGFTGHFLKMHQQNFSFPIHVHRSFELVVVLSGKMKATVSKRTYELTKNRAVLILPNQPHALESTQSECLLFIFSPDSVGAYERKTAGLSPADNSFTVDDPLLKQLLCLEDKASEVKKKVALYSACAAFDENAIYTKKEAAESGLLSEIFAFVEAHYDSDCSLEELSRALGYSECYLSRYFKNSTGCSYLSFLNQYRIDRASLLLSTTDKTILACAVECGYRTLRHFNRSFLTYTGQTPTEFREKNEK